MDDINLNSLKIFYEVANSKSFLDAANKLFVSQPAVSKSIKTLERDLDTVLFNSGSHIINPGAIPIITHIGDILKNLPNNEELMKSLQEESPELYKYIKDITSSPKKLNKVLIIVGLFFFL